MKLPDLYHMLSAQEKKIIRGLAQKKKRLHHGLFLAEGPKTIAELIETFPCRLLVGTEEGFQALQQVYRLRTPLEVLWRKIAKIVCLPEHYDFASLSQLQHPQPLIALFQLPSAGETPLPTSAALLLDAVADPGNVGTILRTCDWFGIRDVYYTDGTADPFSPKVVQASMGSIARVHLYPCTGVDFVDRAKKERIPILGGVLEGKDIFALSKSLPRLSDPMLLILGNEGNGISKEIRKRLTHPLFIPAASSSPQARPESLNVAISLAILLTLLRS